MRRPRRLDAPSSGECGRLQRACPRLAREIADVSSIFGGLIIKYTGDGAIVGFPEPFNVAADMAFDAASAIIADTPL